MPITTNRDLAVVIMAGGVGTRLWPMSTEKRPKQFLKLFGDRSLLQKSFDRVSGLAKPENILVLTNESFVPLVKEQLPEIPSENVIGEPMRKDTAAAIALASLICKKRYDNPVMAVMTADHIIEPVSRFQEILMSAVRNAGESGALYTLGIKPTYPATGYGYLQAEEVALNDNGIKHYILSSFKEKPDIRTAVEYISAGNFFWNSGMFVWTVDSIIDEFKLNLPEHIKLLSNAVPDYGNLRWAESLSAAFEKLDGISIDFGIMEKAANVRMVASDFSWNDVGGWPALEEYLEKDVTGNTHSGRIETFEAESNMVINENGEETVALVGVKDLIIVRAGNSTLVAHKNSTEDIKKLVAGLDDKLK